MATLLGKAGAWRRSEAPRLWDELDGSAAREDEEREEREVDMMAFLNLVWEKMGITNVFVSAMLRQAKAESEATWTTFCQSR